MYIDPTAGSLVLQVLAAGALSAVAMFGRVREGAQGLLPLARAAPMGAQALGASYRDPSGFVYTRDGTLYRQVNRVFQDRLRGVPRLGAVCRAGGARLLVPHARRRSSSPPSPDAVAVLEPERVEFISYPYEWSFGQLRDAALLTLELQERALARGLHPAGRQRLQRAVRRRAARSSSTRSPSSPGRKARPGRATGSSASTSWCRWR